MKVVLNYGMGVDSTVILHRWLTDPSSRDFDLADLIVLSAQTGDEFADTKRLVEAHVLPLLRKFRVRYVQVARHGPRQEDGITVLSDTTEPYLLQIEGDWTLSQELTISGTTPQVASRKCSLKFKGWVLDFWLRREMQDESFRQAMGFNADEGRRVERDACYGGDTRRAEYPLMKWGISREACEDYLADVFGVAWPKSCCVFCPFANGNNDILARYLAMPHAAAEALMLEHLAMALNPNSHLYRDRSLRSVLEEAGNEEALSLFRARLDASPWAIYRVRRVYTSKGHACRSIETIAAGFRRQMALRLYREHGVPEMVAGSFRVWTTRRQPGVYPSPEEFFVVAPHRVRDKQKKTFERHWGRVALAVV